MYMCVDLVSQNTEEVCKDLINFISRFAGPYLLLLFAACVTVLLADSHCLLEVRRLCVSPRSGGAKPTAAICGFALFRCSRKAYQCKMCTYVTSRKHR